MNLSYLDSLVGLFGRLTGFDQCPKGRILEVVNVCYYISTSALETREGRMERAHYRPDAMRNNL